MAKRNSTSTPGNGESPTPATPSPTRPDVKFLNVRDAAYVVSSDPSPIVIAGSADTADLAGIVLSRIKHLEFELRMLSCGKEWGVDYDPNELAWHFLPAIDELRMLASEVSDRLHGRVNHG